MESVSILETPEVFVIHGSEVFCPFCEGGAVYVVSEEGSMYYRCSFCGNDWTVLGG